MKSLRQYLVSAAVVFAMTAAMLAAFPVEMFQFKAAPAAHPRGPAVAFVVLTADAEAKAVKSAKTAWQSDTSVRRHVGVYLSLGDLPADEKPRPLVYTPPGAGLSVKERYSEYGAGAWTPSEAAGAPETIASLPDDSGKQTFPREDLLGLDKKEDRK